MLLQQKHLLLVVGTAEELVATQHVLVPFLQHLTAHNAGEAMQVEHEGLCSHDQLVRQQTVPAARTLYREQPAEC